MIVDYEKTTVGGQESYFDVRPLEQKTTRLGEALSTSRPGTPGFERRLTKKKSTDAGFGKRED